MKTFIRFVFLLSAGTLLMLLPACNEPEIQSSWRDRDITIDGSSDDWNKTLDTYVPESQVLLAATNDLDDLYLRLATGDINLQRRIIHDGCRIWFDSNGGKSKVFGLRFPLGGVMPLPSPDELNKFREQKPTAEQMAGALEEAQDQLEILNSGGSGPGEIVSISVAKGLGIELRIAVTNGVLVYEVKIPFAGKDGAYPFVIASPGTKTIGVGFITGKTTSADMPQGRGPGNTGSPGGFGGQRGARPGGGGFPGGRMPPPGGMHQEPFELWARVHLAVAPPGSTLTNCSTKPWLAVSTCASPSPPASGAR